MEKKNSLEEKKEPTVGLNMWETLKKMLEQAEHIFDTFECF